MKSLFCGINFYTLTISHVSFSFKILRFQALIANIKLIYLLLTGSWSARHVFPLLDYDSALFGVRSMITSFLATYAEQDTPSLIKTPEDYFTGDVNEKLWKEFIAELCNGDIIYEVHVYKVSFFIMFYYRMMRLSRLHFRGLKRISNKK